MKILLISPPTIHRGGSGKPALHIPIGLISIAAMLEEKGHVVEIYDTKVNHNIERRKGYVYFGDKSETIKERIRESNPDVVGISNQFTVYLKNAKKVAELVKEVNKKIPVIIGGPHASVAPLDFLKDKNIDFVVMCEGEYTIVELLEYLNGKKDIKNIKGVGYKEHDKIKINQPRQFIEDLDSLPLPAYHLIDMEKYFTGLFSPRSEYCSRAVSIITSRGCPYSCVFCSVHLHIGRKWRAHSAEYVLRHLKLLVDEYNVGLIHFEDDNFTLDKKRFEEILDGIINEGIKIKWDTPNGVRADTFTKDLLIKAKKSGCQYLIIGVESGNQRVLDKVVKKGLDLKKVVRVAEWCKEIDLDLEAFFVIGFPGETIQDMRDTFEFAKMLNEKYGVYPHFNIATPLINTELYDICESNNYFIKGVDPQNLLIAQRGGGGMIKTPEFGPEDIESLFREYSFFIKTARLKKALKHPYLIRSYLMKEISKTKVYDFIKGFVVPK